ncbi:MAG: hypothetical protein AAF805_06220 [Planctomycetota bacterium]
MLAQPFAAALDALRTAPVGGYAPGGDDASEPTAYAAVALAAAGETDAARTAAEWLADRQAPDGAVGVTAEEREPCWPTALAMIAWDAVDPFAYANRIEAGARWALAQRPWTIERDVVFGHDTTLEGWSWAPDTHSWLEPTSFFLVALRVAGKTDEPRYEQAVRLIVDRLLPGGGVNYGNTTVFGQTLLQHLQPSGVVAWALADEPSARETLGPTVDYLRTASARPTGVASLAWAARGLAACDATDESLAARLADAWPRVAESGSHHKTALFALAAQAVSARLAPPVAATNAAEAVS